MPANKWVPEDSGGILRRTSQGHNMSHCQNSMEGILSGFYMIHIVELLQLQSPGNHGKLLRGQRDPQDPIRPLVSNNLDTSSRKPSNIPSKTKATQKQDAKATAKPYHEAFLPKPSCCIMDRYPTHTLLYSKRFVVKARMRTHGRAAAASGLGGAPAPRRRSPTHLEGEHA